MRQRYTKVVLVRNRKIIREKCILSCEVERMRNTTVQKWTNLRKGTGRYQNNSKCAKLKNQITTRITYKELVTIELPRQLRRHEAEKAKFRCCNEKGVNRYWSKGEKRWCRMCGKKKEILERALKECARTIINKMERRTIMLRKDGSRISHMRRLSKRRETTDT